MIRFRTSILAAALGFLALASSPARADLEITINGVGGLTLCPTCYSTSDTNASFVGVIGNFDITNLSIAGYQDFFGNGLLMDNANLDIASTGSGSLTILLSQNNLTGGQIIKFLTQFSAPILVGVTATRSFFLDAGNVLNAETTALGSTSSGGFQSFLNTVDLRMHAHYSLTEEIDVTANASGGTLSSDDQVSMVPEPVSLSLFGSGLLGLGVLSRRRRKAAKSV